MMEYELFIYTKLTYEELLKEVERSFKLFFNKEMNIIQTEESVYMGMDKFSFSIELDEQSDIDFVSDNYQINVNTYFSIEVYNKTFDKGILEALQLMGMLLEKSTSALFLEIGDRQLFRKEQGQLWINNNLEDYQKEYLNAETIHLLSSSFKEKKMKMM
ncbi:hypothetical protein [Enterococcus sp. LJL51]|uniref:hypothetical protein n=1 Tax=Enterococcus sp. LJL51 TaxID=3416656 RepID=UPI003CE90C00